MAASGQYRSGKGSHDENFPVASLLIRPRHRPAILAFYEFVRVADDIADHPSMPGAEKLDYLDKLEATLLGNEDGEPEGVALRAVLRRHGLTPLHAQHLLQAFRQDVIKKRYTDWDDLIDYCRLSAMPVGRYVLDVHGEPQSTWAASDALCAALQVINHIQDCAKDYRNLDRVYVPLDALGANGLDVSALAAPQASAALKKTLRGLVDRTAMLLEQSRPLASQVGDVRLAMEIAAIQTLAERLIGVLREHDPLRDKVHLSKAAMLMTAGRAAASVGTRRLFGRTEHGYRAQPRES